MNHYQIAPLTGVNLAPVPKMHRCKFGTTTGANLAPDRCKFGTLNKTKEQDPLNKTQRARADFDAKSAELPFTSDAFRTAWLAWCNHRLEIHHKLTPTTVAQQLKRFAAWGEARTIAAIEHSIANGWRGCFEPDSNGKSPPAIPEGFRL